MNYKCHSASSRTLLINLEAVTLHTVDVQTNGAGESAHRILIINFDRAGHFRARRENNHEAVNKITDMLLIVDKSSSSIVSLCQTCL